MHRSRLLIRCIPSVALLASTHCMPTTDSSDTGQDTTDTNVTQYQELEQKLLGNESTAVNSNASPSTPSPYGNQLFYLEFPVDNPTVPSLRRYDDTSRTTLAYSFAIGTTDQDTPYNYSASPTLVTTVDVTGDTPVLRAYSATSPNTEVGSLTLPSPPDGEIFQANAVDGNKVYYIDDSSDAVLVEWVAGSDSTTTNVLTFSKLGVDATSAMNFTVSGSELLLEDYMGALWSIDIATQKATAIGNTTQATGGSYSATGFLYTTDAGASNGLYYYDFSTKQTTDVAAEIRSSSYSLNSTYSMIHDYSSGSAFLNGVVYYIGEGHGLYSFELSSKTVTPLLLTPQDDSVEYQSPSVLDDGTLFVLGIDTTDPGPGSGTIYRVSTGG